VDVPENNQDQL
jgi:hypothetical protein